MGIIIFVFGLIVGSFLNAVIFRLRIGQSFVGGRSRCMTCKRELATWDLIPVLSFIFLRGRCRYCKTKISWQYPFVELVTAITFLLLAQNFSAGGGSAFGGQFSFLDFQFWMQAIFASFLIVIAVYDFKHYLILDKVVYPAIVLAIGFNLYQDWASGCFNSIKCEFAFGLLGGLIIALFFFLQHAVSAGRWIGFGDVKLGFFIGNLLGFYHGLFSLFAAYMLGAAVGLALIFLKKKDMSSRLPFGTFLSISAIITMIYGPQIIKWYLKLIGF